MNTLLRVTQKFDSTLNSLRFVRKHFLIILILGLIAGLGRAAQLRAFGAIAPWLDTFLEITIQTARILIFLFSLGLTNVKKGITRFVSVFSFETGTSKNWKSAWAKLKTEWVAVTLNMAAFLFISFLINLMIDHIAYETCLYLTLKRDGLLSADSSEWAIILFFKNISVIPFTLVFNATLLLWFANRLPQHVREA
ncbi:hypothetical protein [Dyadobacter arcticus]|uniref:Tripartite ATP-independent transporter, DctQ component n=1 Tax=Dyadobacter arcticus TaxID=1078754 RepID=A0ABX0UMD3_9BACT|nr:hypothetical protein [Dyadobacter arcticus]NIJ54168.1 hypothetical protein [Dyadobacter arcticus]